MLSSLRAWRIAPAVAFAAVRAGQKGHDLRAIGGWRGVRGNAHAGFGSDLAKPTAWAELAPLRPQRSFVPPVSTKPGVFGWLGGAETPAGVRPADHAVRPVSGLSRAAGPRGRSVAVRRRETLACDREGDADTVCREGAGSPRVGGRTFAGASWRRSAGWPTSILRSGGRASRRRRRSGR